MRDALVDEKVNTWDGVGHDSTPSVFFTRKAESMRINRNGHACHGLLTLCVDGTIALPRLRSTAPDWLDDRLTAAPVAIYQRETVPNRWQLEACDTTTHVTWPLEPEIAPTERKGATVIYGGAGIWAAWGAGGIRSNVYTGPELVRAGLWGVGRDGTLGYCRDQQSGMGIVFRAPNGNELEIEAKTTMHDVHIVAYGIAAYVHGGRLYTVGTPTPVTVKEEIFEPRLLQLHDGNWALSYHTQDRLLFQPKIGIPEGKVVFDGPSTYSPDLCEIRPNRVRLVWSTTPGEGPAAFRATGRTADMPDIDLTQPMDDLATPVVPPVPPDPPPAPARPRITFVYEPHTGSTPLTVRAVCVISGGPANRVYWFQRLTGVEPWTLVADNPATDADHHYHFTVAGVYELSAKVTGPGGSDQTGVRRPVTVT